MTDTDPRLEAAQRAYMKYCSVEYDPASTEPAGWVTAIYDALRAFDQAQPVESEAAVSGLQMRYFVLKPKGSGAYAQASRAAMRSYAMMIRTENKQMSYELRAWADREEIENVPTEVKSCPKVVDNATAPIMGADPTWFDELCEKIKLSHRWSIEDIIRDTLAFANAQPPSETQVSIALSRYLQYLGHYSTVVDPAGIEAMRAALIAAAS